MVSRVLLCLQGPEEGPRALRSPCGREGLTCRRCRSAVPGRCWGRVRRFISTLKVKEIFLWERLDGEAIFLFPPSHPSSSLAPLLPSPLLSLLLPPAPSPATTVGRASCQDPGSLSGTSRNSTFLCQVSTFLVEGREGGRK